MLRVLGFVLVGLLVASGCSGSGDPSPSEGGGLVDEAQSIVASTADFYLTEYTSIDCSTEGAEQQREVQSGSLADARTYDVVCVTESATGTLEFGVTTEGGETFANWLTFGPSSTRTVLDLAIDEAAAAEGVQLILAEAACDLQFLSGGEYRHVCVVPTEDGRTFAASVFVNDLLARDYTVESSAVS